MKEQALELFSKSTRSIAEGVNTDSLASKLDQLMPSVYIMIATLGALLILIMVLTKFFYKPVKKMVKERQEFIQKNIDESIAAKEKAFKYEQQARQQLDQTSSIAMDIILQSQKDAESIKNNYINQSKQESAALLEETKKQIQIRKLELEKETYQEIVKVAVDISEKIIKDKISEKEVKSYLDSYLGKENDD